MGSAGWFLRFDDFWRSEFTFGTIFLNGFFMVNKNGDGACKSFEVNL